MKKILSFLIASIIVLGSFQTVSAQLAQCVVHGTVYDWGTTTTSGLELRVVEVTKSGTLLRQFGNKPFKSDKTTGIIAFVLPRLSNAKFRANFGGFDGTIFYAIPDADSVNLSTLVAATFSSQTQSGFVTIQEVDGSPTITIQGLNDTLIVSNGTLTAGTNSATISTAGASHDILSATHSDAQTATLVRGDVLIAQTASPELRRLVLGASGTILRSDGTDLVYTTATFPATTVVNQILFSSATNVIGGIATSNSQILQTSAGGVPSFSATLPNAVQDNITRLGTITVGVWNGTAIADAFVLDNITIDLAATATALAANGGNATAGNAILGVDALGAAEGAFDVWTEAENTTAAYIANLAEDVSPQLGADLDANSFDIQFDDADGIFDSNSNEQVLFQLVASAVNYFEFTNAIATASPSLVVQGTDANIDLTLDGKGSGVVKTLSSNLDITGNIIVSGTVDSRDIATDGTKLDGIETAATADQTDEEIDDAAGPLVATGGTKTRITVTYQDGTDDIDFVVDDMNDDNPDDNTELPDMAAYTFKMRNAGSTGDPGDVKISALTDRAAFGTGDKLIIEESTGETRKIDFDDLPGAGGGLSNVVEDVTPQSGGDHDMNTFDIQFDDATGIRDDSDNEQLIFQKTASAINHVEMTNAAAGGEPLIAAVGGDTDVSLTLDGKGAGTVRTLSSNLDITGNIVVSGTVDGVDIAIRDHAVFAPNASPLSDHSGFTEEVEDLYGAATTSNTETRITVTYDDADGTVDYVVDDMNDDVPESGDFGNADDLETTGELSADVVDQAKIADDAIQEEHLKAVNTPVDEDIVTFEATTGDFEYHTLAELGIQPLDADLTTLAAPTAWRVFYSDGSSVITELALGASGTFLQSNGATSAPTFAVPGGGGDVSKVGTPVDNQIGVWTGDGTIEGTADFTFDGADFLFYNAVNDGNPEIRLGATDAEELHIQPVFDGGAQTLNHVLFQTDVASATADRGLFRFNVDGSNILDIDDGGLVLTGDVVVSGLVDGVDVAARDHAVFVPNASPLSDHSGFTEEVEDLYGASTTSNTETRITVTYDDADGTVDYVVDDMNDVEVNNLETADPPNVLLNEVYAGTGSATGAWTLTPTLAGTNFTGTGASFTAGVSTLATVTDNESTAEENPIVFVAGADPDGGTLGLETDGNATYNPSTGTITAPEFIGGGVGITGVTASHAGTITWTGTSILESGVAFGFGDASDATLTHTYANTGTDVTIAYSTAAMAVTGALIATNLSGTNTGDEAAASVTVVGVSELATAAETTTGTDATRALTPDGYAGSDHGVRNAEVLVTVDYDTDTATGDGKAYFVIPTEWGGMNLVSAHAEVITAGTTTTLDVQIHNLTQAADMLSTKLTIDSTENGSDTAAIPEVIDAANDDVAAFDVIRFDIDSIHTTPAKGLIVILGFQVP